MKKKKSKVKSIDDKLIEDEFQSYRKFDNKYVKLIRDIILALIPIFGVLYILGVHQMIGLTFYAQQYIGLFLGLVLSATFMSVPPTKHSSKTKVPWFDWILAVLGLSAGLYILINYPTIVTSMAMVTTTRFIFSVMAILVVLEAIRRVLGKGLLIIVLVFIAYAYAAPYLPSVFKGSSSSTSQLFNYLYLDSNSMLDLLNIAATVALSFILLGQILFYFGGADIINDFAISAFGRYRGGPAKGAIVGSSLVGTITGGPVANVLLVGNVTIPLMKKNGYTAAEAGAIESVASTGGSIMPPVMGVAAFMIAETLGVPYSKIALAALVPAVLYYVCLFFQVDLLAGKKGIGRLSKENIPAFKAVMKRGWLILAPIAMLVYLLFFKGMTPQMSGLYAGAVAIIFLIFQKSMRLKALKLIPLILVDTGKVLLEIGVVLSAAGIVVGITSVTGLGFNLGMILSSFGQYGLLTLLILCAIVSLILGMGMPSVAAYALVAVLVAPTLVDLGVNPISAHLFVYYFSIISNFTPPVAMACFTAAPIAKENPTKIGIEAFKLGLVAYIVPFLFVYAPDLMLGVQENGVSWISTLITIVTAILGCYLLSMSLVGFLHQKLSTIKRIITLILAIGLFIPLSTWQYSWIINLVAVIGMVLFLVKEWVGNRKTDYSPSINNAN